MKNAALLGGAAAASGCSPQEPRPAAVGVTVGGSGQRAPPTLHPHHNDRTKGWLRFLWEKATTPDDWSYRGDEELPWGITMDAASQRSTPDFTVGGNGPHPKINKGSSKKFKSTVPRTISIGAMTTPTPWSNA